VLRLCWARRPSALTRSSKRLEGIAIVLVFVRDNNVDSALRVLKKQMQRDGTFREMKLRRAYEKPSERRTREKKEGMRRLRKALRKRLEREGY
jgi:small subunit ribosomal protein S21